MPPKRGDVNSILGRIDERTLYIQKEQDNVRRDLRDMKSKVFDKLEEHGESIAVIEDKDRNRVHIPKNNGGGKFLATIISGILKVFK